MYLFTSSLFRGHVFLRFITYVYEVGALPLRVHGQVRRVSLKKLSRVVPFPTSFSITRTSFICRDGVGPRVRGGRRY